MFSVGNVGDRKRCHDGLSFAFRKELPHFFLTHARTCLKDRAEMAQQRVRDRGFGSSFGNICFRAEKYGVPLDQSAFAYAGTFQLH